jgi:serine/threonine protein kinase
MKLNWENRVTLTKNHILIDDETFFLDNIEFNNIIDSGANAIVIKGFDTVLMRIVAIKVWLTKINDRRDKIKQGLEESRKIAQLEHNRIVKVYNAGVFNNTLFYLVMEYVKGETLKKLISKTDFYTRYFYWLEIEDGMKAAHEKNIFHGDLHAGNILIKEDHILILDFGTSIFNRGNSMSRESKMIKTLTQKIFPEFSLKKFEYYPFNKLKPQHCLSHCSGWVQILYCLKILSNKSLDDYKIRHTLIQITILISESPLFNVNTIISLIPETIKDSNRYMVWFLDYLISSIWGEMKDLDMVPISVNPDEKIESKMVKLKQVQNDATNLYLKNASL